LLERAKHGVVDSNENNPALTETEQETNDFSFDNDTITVPQSLWSVSSIWKKNLQPLVHSINNTQPSRKRFLNITQ